MELSRRSTRAEHKAAPDSVRSLFRWARVSAASYLISTFSGDDIISPLPLFTFSSFVDYFRNLVHNSQFPRDSI